jgi:hypothetical protein
MGYENMSRIQANSLQAVNQTNNTCSGSPVTDRAGMLYLQEMRQCFEIYMFVGVVNQISSCCFIKSRNIWVCLGINKKLQD